MSKIQILKDFIIFLKKNYVLEDFITSFNNGDYYRKEYGIEHYFFDYFVWHVNYKPHELILNAFSWHDDKNTVIKHDWYDLSSKWHKYYKEKYEK